MWVVLAPLICQATLQPIWFRIVVIEKPSTRVPIFLVGSRPKGNMTFLLLAQKVSCKGRGIKVPEI